MARQKFKTLTEQMFYVLLCLEKECCGTQILLRIEEMTQGRVTVGSGTLYNLLEQEIAPTYYAKNDKGFSAAWLALMKKSIREIS